MILGAKFVPSAGSKRGGPAATTIPSDATGNTLEIIALEEHAPQVSEATHKLLYL
jgi:hypothetical protein